jgi:hypothetical protein
VLVPTLLAVLCGLRRGEICALRWRNVDLVTGQISVAESLQQTKTGPRFKSPKSGKGRTVRGVVEPRALTPAQELLRLGVWLSNDDLVISHADDSVISPIYVSQHWGTHYPHHQAGTTPVPRPAARSRDPFARQRRPPEGRQRAFGAQQGCSSPG